MCHETVDMLLSPTGVGPVNECASNNGGCAQICMDTTDSFTCLCNSGFRLDSDGRSCNGK